MNLSAVLEEALAEKVAQMKREQWLRENCEGVEAYNALVQGQGSFGDTVRSFGCRSSRAKPLFRCQWLKE